MDRRSFIRRSAAGSAAAFFSTSVLGRDVLTGVTGEEADIAVINGTDIFNNTLQAVKVLGGMEKFVAQGARVGLLINSDFDQAGAYVHPDISLATIQMCLDAGASEVVILQVVNPKYWERSELYQEKAWLFEKVTTVRTNIFPAEFNEEDWKLVPHIEGARCLKEVEVIRALKEVDALINIFIAKHHPSTLYTGALKNSMGFCTRKTNVFCHLGSGERNDHDFLAQCICDINQYRKPDLIIGDAVAFITTNGPSGPGEISTLNKVFAGTNLVAMDALGATYNGLDPADVLTLIKAEASGLGKRDLGLVNIVEIS